MATWFSATAARTCQNCVAYKSIKSVVVSVSQNHLIEGLWIKDQGETTVVWSMTVKSKPSVRIVRWRLIMMQEKNSFGVDLHCTHDRILTVRSCFEPKTATSALCTRCKCASPLSFWRKELEKFMQSSGLREKDGLSYSTRLWFMMIHVYWSSARGHARTYSWMKS